MLDGSRVISWGERGESWDMFCCIYVRGMMGLRRKGMAKPGEFFCFKKVYEIYHVARALIKFSRMKTDVRSTIFQYS